MPLFPQHNTGCRSISRIISFLNTHPPPQYAIDVDGDHNNIIINNGEGNSAPQSNHPDTSLQPSEDSISDSFEQESASSTKPMEIGMPFVEELPDNHTESVSLGNWDEEKDRDIVGNTYSNNTFKFYAVDILNSIVGSGTSSFNANVHIPFGGKGSGTCYLCVFAVKDMVGNGSAADVTIFADGEEIQPTFSLTSTTTDELRFPIELDGVRDVVLHFEGRAVGAGYCAGFTVEDAVES